MPEENTEFLYHGIWFSEKPDSAYFFAGSYIWKHVPTGTTGTRTIFTYTEKNFVRLIEEFNNASQDWVYTRL